MLTHPNYKLTAHSEPPMLIEVRTSSDLLPTEGNSDNSEKGAPQGLAVSNKAFTVAGREHTRGAWDTRL